MQVCVLPQPVDLTANKLDLTFARLIHIFLM